MKKFFAAVACCALFSMNVMAQQPAPVAGDVVEAPVNLSVVETADSDATLVSTVQEAAPAATPVPDVTAEAAPTVVGEVFAPQGVVTEGYAPVEMTLAPYQDQTFTAAPFTAPIQSGCGCGQVAPVMNYDAGVSYGAPIQAAPVADCGCAAPVADCGCAAAPAADCCCEAGRTRPQVISRARGRFTSVRGRVGSRRNSDCCCN